LLAVEVKAVSELKRLLEQIMWLAVCLYHEARGETVEGQLAVGHAIMNRVNNKDMSVKKIVLSPWQFSWANISTVQGQPLPPVENYLAFIECQHSALVCLIERLEGKDFNGADHYFNPSIVLPSWADSMDFIASVGGHDFYRS
jgi:hypothetical protein